ncbi:MAG TPA: MgtC/SapB family protein [Gaiellaceae bacterium]
MTILANSTLFVLGGWAAFGRLALAAGLGAAVGIERELREREAGIRTHLLVSLGACLFTLVSAYGFEGVVRGGQVVVDPTRIAAQIVTGIGFLGAGAIIRDGISVRGLTTAASLWIVAAIGMATGAGYYWPAVAGTALTVFALWPLRFAAYHLLERFRPPERRLVVELRQEASVDRLLGHLDTRMVEIEQERDRRVVTLELEQPIDDALVARVSDLDEVVAVRWHK